MCGCRGTIGCYVEDTDHPPVGGIIIITISIHYHCQHIVLLLGCCFLSIFFLGGGRLGSNNGHNVRLTEKPEELVLASAESCVINVCHLLNFVWSRESIVPDVFSADISLPAVVCLAFPC